MIARIVLSTLFFVFLSGSLLADTITPSYEKDWQKVDQAIIKKDKKLASEILFKILEESKNVKGRSVYLKALMYRFYIDNDGKIGTNEHMLFLQKELSSAKVPEKQILHVMLAKVMTENIRNRYYSQQKQLKFNENDITTWTNEQLRESAEYHFKKALAHPKKTQAASVDAIAPLLRIYDMTFLKMRPTAYDVIAYEALDFYLKRDSETIRGDSIFAVDTATFLAMKIDPPEKGINNWKAMQVLQQIMKFHASKNHHEAFVDAELFRLNILYKNNVAVYWEKVKDMLAKYSDGPGYGLIVHRLVQNPRVLVTKDISTKEDSKWDYKVAAELCREVIQKWPDTMGSLLCQSTLKSLEKQVFSMTVESVNQGNKPFRIMVAFQNVKKMYFKAVPYVYEVFSNEQISDHVIMKNEPALTWECDLPDDGDMKMHTTEIICPGLDYGNYFLVASSSPNFTEITHTQCYITDLSVSTMWSRKGTVLLVLDRYSGKPLSNVEVITWERQNDEGTTFKEYRTDQIGMVTVPESSRFEIIHGKDRFYSYHSYYGEYDYQEEAEYVHFFTDRNIYRPGQTVYYKIVAVNIKGHTNKLRANEEMTIFISARQSGFEQRIEVKTNNFGSYSGSFVIPENLKGTKIELNCGSYYSQKTIYVEEYKRPKFEVTFPEKLQTLQYKDPIKVVGTAAAFGDFPIDNASVKYSIYRVNGYELRNFKEFIQNQHIKVNYYGYDEDPFARLTNSIKTAETFTDGKGQFTIDYFPEEKEKSDKNNHLANSYGYVIIADVTDSNGETRRGVMMTVINGQSFYLECTMPSVVYFPKKTLTIPITAKNDIGNTVSTKVMVSIYREPKQLTPERSRLWEIPEKQSISSEEFSRLFPYDRYEKIQEPADQEPVYTQEFDVSKDESISINDVDVVQHGKYRMKIKAFNAFGNESEKELSYTINDETSLPESGHLLVFYVEEKVYNVGEVIRLHCWSALESTLIIETISATHEGRKVVTVQKGYSFVTIPVDNRAIGGVNIHVYAVRLNREFRAQFYASVPWTTNTLNIVFERFRNKLLPGEQDEWTMRITGSMKERVFAEMVAGMYDASLDMFVDNSWQFPEKKLYHKNNYSRSSDFRLKGNIASAWISDYTTIAKYLQYPMLVDLPFITSKISGNNQYQPIYFGGPNGKIRGKVIDAETGEPIPGATVFVEGTQLGASTMANGEYFILQIPPGLHKVKCLIVGYTTRTEENIIITSGSTTTVEFKMHTRIAGAEYIVVQAKKPIIDKMDSAIEMFTTSLEPSEIAHQSDLLMVNARKDFKETVFFYPHLYTNEKGEIVFKFMMPEAITRWNFFAFAHTRDMKTALVKNSVITQKNLMVVPSPPRFLRVGDTIDFTCKVTNIGKEALKGRIELFLFDPETMKPVGKLFGVHNTQKTFEALQGSSDLVTWRLKIPAGMSAVIYRVAARSGNFTDGEEMMIPILTDGAFVTDSLYMPLHSLETRSFELKGLTENRSDTLQQHKLILEFTSNPAWYAIEALPYLIEYPYGCMEQTFSGYYANSVALHILNRSPKVKSYFDDFRKKGNREVLVQSIYKNKELYALLNEEMPWLVKGRSSEEYRYRVSQLYDLDTLAESMDKAFEKFLNGQNVNGSLSWFPGGQEDRYITQHIITGFGHLKQLNVINWNNDYKIKQFLEKAVRYLDSCMYDTYLNIPQNGWNRRYYEIHYLYMRSFFREIPLSKEYSGAVDYFIAQISANWQTESLYSQAMTALVLHRYGDSATALAILDDIKKRSTYTPESGMFWNKDNYGYCWYNAPIETQTLLIEAFLEIANDRTSADNMKFWLLKNRKNRYWVSTKATVEACNALLMGGSSIDEALPPQVTMGKKKVELVASKKDSENNAGYFLKSWSEKEITSDLGKIVISNRNNNVAFGSLYWQYFEKYDKINSSDSNIKITKKLFVERLKNGTVKFEEVTPDFVLHPGDRVTVRIEFQTPDYLEYVHIKDGRASTFEPISVLSGYKYSSSVSYYESMRDVSANFFISYLYPGKYAIEYKVTVTHAGEYSSGITQLQCMYAPELSGHSQGIRVQVKE